MVLKINKELYKDTEDYLEKCDVKSRMHKIRSPFFFISALDDPVMGDMLPVEEINDFVMIGCTKYGGHCCHFEGQGFWPDGCFYPKPAMEFLSHFATSTE